MQEQERAKAEGQEKLGANGEGSGGRQALERHSTQPQESALLPPSFPSSLFLLSFFPFFCLFLFQAFSLLLDWLPYHDLAYKSSTDVRLPGTHKSNNQAQQQRGWLRWVCGEEAVTV